MSDARRADEAVTRAAYSPVFVFGCAWRSGSTLLQRLINSSREVLVWGENAAMTGFLMRIQDNLSRWSSLIERQHKNYETHLDNGWIANLNPAPPEPALEASRSYFLSYYCAATLKLGYERWGFKEVRHGAAHAKFLLECFPRGRVVFLLRDPRDVLASNAGNHWYREVGGARGVTRRWLRNTESFSVISDPRILTVRFEDICGHSAAAARQLEDHLQLSLGSIDLGVLRHRVRGSRDLPRTGKEEADALGSEGMHALAKAFGYDLAAT